MQMCMVCSSASAPSLLRSLVLISYMALKERSTVAVVTGNTFTIAATFAKFGKAGAISELPLSINVESTCYKVLSLYLTKMTRRNSFHSDSVSSALMSGCEMPISP